MLKLGLKKIKDKSDFDDLLGLVERELQINDNELEEYFEKLTEKKKIVVKSNNKLLEMKVIKGGEQETDDYEKEIMKYLRELMILNSYISKNDLNYRECMEDNLWADTCRSGEMKNAASLIDEIQNTIYNFVVIKLIIGILKLISVGLDLVFGEDKEIQTKENGVQKVKNGLWGLEMIRNIGRGNQQFGDLGFDQIVLLEQYVTLIYYAAQFEIQGGAQENVYKEWYQISQNAKQIQIIIASILQKVEQLKKNQKVDLNIKIQIATNCRSLFYYYRIQMNYCLSLYYEELAKTNPDNGNFGFALACITSCQQLINKHAKTIIENELVMTRNIKELEKMINERVVDMNMRNSKIYKESVVQIPQLEFQQDQQQKLASKMPKMFGELDHPVLKCLMGQEISSLQEMCKQHVDEIYNKLDQQFQKYKGSKNNDYNINNVNYLVNLIKPENNEMVQQLEQSMLSQSILQRVDQLFDEKRMMMRDTNEVSCIASEHLIKKVNMNSQDISLYQKVDMFQKMSTKMDLEDGILTLNSIAEASQTLVTEIYELLDQEIKADCQLREQYKEKWINQNSNVVQKDIRTKVDKYSNHFKSANKIDNQFIQKYQKYKQYYPKIKANPGIFNLSVKDQMKTKYQTQLADIQSKDQNIQQQEQAVQQIIDSCQNYLQQHKVFQQLKKMIDSEKLEVKQKVFIQMQELENQFVQKLGSLNDSLNCLYVQSNELSSMIKQDDGIIDIQQDQEVLNSLQVFIDIYLKLEQGISFYSRLMDLLSSCKQNVSDFCLARQIQSDNLVEIIEAEQKNRNNQEL